MNMLVDEMVPQEMEDKRTENKIGKCTRRRDLFKLARICRVYLLAEVSQENELPNNSTESSKETVEGVVSYNQAERKLCSAANHKVDHESVDEPDTRRSVLLVGQQQLHDVDHDYVTNASARVCYMNTRDLQ